MVTFSYGIDGLPDQVVVETPLGDLLLFGQEPLGRHQYEIHPTTEDWKLDDVVWFIYEDYKSQPGAYKPDDDNTIEVTTITYGRVSSYAFRYTVLEEGLPINIQSPAFYETEAWENESKHSFYKNFGTFDYIIEMENYTNLDHEYPPALFFHEEENFVL